MNITSMQATTPSNSYYVPVVIEQDARGGQVVALVRGVAVPAGLRVGDGCGQCRAQCKGQGASTGQAVHGFSGCMRPRAGRVATVGGWPL